MAHRKGKFDVETCGHRVIRAVAALIVMIPLSFGVFGCGQAESTSQTVDKVSEPGVTQPPPPDANSNRADNPRDRKNRKERPNVDPEGTPEPSVPKPAAENSEVSAMMNSDGSITEFRVFKDHPYIAKAEARWMEPSTKDIRVVLRDGRVLAAKTDRIPYLHEAPSTLILEVVGFNRR